MPKVLIIEDEAILRNEMTDWLMFEDYQVLNAENGMIGVKHAIQWVPDLIVCDIMMPELDGYGVFLEVHSNPMTARIPFIFVTARASHDDIRSGMNLGADDYITKPFTRLQLLEAVQTQLKKSAMREQLHNEEVQQLKEALTQEHSQSLLKVKLVAMFSHDFRNPLAAILSSNNLVRDYASQINEERRLKHLNRIESSVHQLVQMLDDMLFIAQMESASIEYKPTMVDIGEQIAEIVDEFRTIHDENYQIEYANEVSDSVVADVRLLRQVASNLISNAIKYSPPHSMIFVSLTRQDDNYLFTVEDQGVGIEPEDQATLFEAFKRGSNVGNISGTGLGLAIVKRAVDLFGGQIYMESQVGQGTRMTVTIPVVHQAEGQTTET